MNRINTKSAFLYLLIGSVLVSALAGIGVMLFGDFGEREIRILVTTLTITATSVLGLACGASLESGKLWFIPLAGIVFSILSGVLWIVMLWSAFDRASDLFPHLVMSATLLAVACSHISLLSLATLDRRFYWSRIAVHVFVWSLTALTLFVIWSHIDPSQTMLARTMGVLSIVIGALTIVTPVFHKLSVKETGEDIDAEIENLKARIAKLESKRAIVKD